MKKNRPIRWSNWSGSVRCHPEAVVYPASVGEVAEIVRHARDQGKQVRIAGRGHSFTPLVQTEHILLSLDSLQGLLEVDEEGQTATLWAGTQLKQAGKLLHQEGWAQENMGDINVQSLAGAISTGTHGTGAQLGSLSTQVEELTMVTASGEIIRCSKQERPQLFRAACLSLGTLGVITQIKLRVLPAYRLHYASRRCRLSELLQRLEEWKKYNRHFEFYWFPYTETVQAKWINVTDLPSGGKKWWKAWNQVVLENGLYWLLSEGVRLLPGLSGPVSRLSARAVPVSEEVGESHRMFATPRWVRFNEMEYAVPAEAMASVLEEIRFFIQREQIQVHFPIECRFVQKDDLWLSPAYDRDSAYIAVHMYKGMPYDKYFTGVEQIFRRYGGRPHWGKLHYLTAEELGDLYPKWNDFREIRAEWDPDGVFLTPYLQKLLGGGKREAVQV
ncbi:FAD-binding oxidoreductase [Marinithermofilum abyssi]|uniref:FAD-binding oxidoreductase n=1 Tax=Marinithermofilum abyssi TaxID=1571185 RepID=A0A8J2VD16_9BACL|nr:D-arabinono-1,4-lactone oxidase [Marinithermofilum abyssi]GGE03779.1 FAD-binding oxidoreductase [Marinithermofilum abyssi]